MPTMYIKVDKQHADVLTESNIAYKDFGGTLYVSLADLKAAYDVLSGKIDVGKIVRYDKLVFTADYAAVAEVS